jgi:hypothetical protein
MRRLCIDTYTYTSTPVAIPHIDPVDENTACLWNIACLNTILLNIGLLLSIDAAGLPRKLCVSVLVQTLVMTTLQLKLKFNLVYFESTHRETELDSNNDYCFYAKTSRNCALLTSTDQCKLSIDLYLRQFDCFHHIQKQDPQHKSISLA